MNHLSVNLVSVSACVSVNAGFIFVLDFQKNLSDICEDMNFDFHIKKFRRLRISRKGS